MSKKKILCMSIIMGLIPAVAVFIFFWPRTVRAENDAAGLWDYSRLWDYSYDGLQSAYGGLQSDYWANYDLRSNQSFITYSPGDDFLGLLSQGLPVYIPANVPFYENYYGGLGSPGGYLPASQWPAYSYAVPYRPFGMYVLETYPGQGFGGPRLITREEWWENEVESHSPEHAMELQEKYGVAIGLHHGFSGVPPWEEQPTIINCN